MAFDGFPIAALDFYDDLEQDNSRVFWEEHKEIYARAVREPMEALVDELEDEFGPARVFRPHRDVRFAADKSPYKTHQGAFVRLSEANGWYVELSAAGVKVGAGFYAAEPATLRLLRRVIDGPDGATLQRIVDGLVGQGWELGGQKLKTAPRGYGVDHPRIELLRHKTMTFGKDYGFGPIVHSPKLVDRVRADWDEARGFVEWVASHAG